MTKSIYEEAHEDVRRLMQDEFDDTSRHEKPKLNKQERIDICIGVKQVLEKAQKQEKLLKLYKKAYDDSNNEILKMLTNKQDEKTTMSNIIYHLDNVDSVQKIRVLENE